MICLGHGYLLRRECVRCDPAPEVAVRSAIVPLVATASHVMQLRAAAAGAESTAMTLGDGSALAGFTQVILPAFTATP